MNGPVSGGGRFAQLTYASADRSGRSGGWQVQDTLGDLTVAERTALTDGIRTRLPDGVPVPPFPSAAEIAALPHRVVYTPLDGIGGAWWHTAPCGTDSQGRPGNVFVHVVLDRAAIGPAGGALRPSDLCGRDLDGWLCPFGHPEVVAASLADVPELPWPPSPGRERVVGLLRDPSYVGALCRLLDAVDAALRGGPPVTLGLREPRDAGLWVAALCHLMSPGTARQLGWSTWERTDPRAPRAPGVHLAVVPYDDVAAVGDRAVGLVEDEDEAPAGHTDAPRPTRGGSTVVVTAWSELFYEVAAQPVLLPAVLDEMDRVAAAAGDHGLDPAWPLAMVVALRAGDFRDALRAAAEVLRTGCPEDLGATRPELYRHVLELSAAEIADGVPAAWAAVLEAGPAGPDDPGRRIWIDLFLIRAVTDPDWRATTGRVDGKLHRRGPTPVAVTVAVADRLADLAGAVGAGVPEEFRVPTARAIVRVGDLLWAAGIAPPDRLTSLYRWVTTEVLTHPVLAHELVQVLVYPGGAAAALRGLLAEHVRTLDVEPGSRIPPVVLRMLGVRLPAVHGPDRPDPLVRELAAQVLFVDPDPRSRAWPIRVRELLDQPEQDRSASELRALLDAGRPGPPAPGVPGWDGRSLAALLDHPNAGRLHECVVDALRGLPPGEEADVLHRAADWWLDRLPDGTEQDELAGVLRVRTLAAGSGRRDDVALLRAAEGVLGALPAETTAAWIWQAVLAADLGAAVRAAFDRTRPPHRLSGQMQDRLRRGGADRTGRTRVAQLLADDPAVPDAALVYAGACLRWAGTEAGRSAWTELRRAEAAAQLGEGELSPVDRAAVLRARDPRRFDDDDLDSGLRRLREDLRPERRGLRRLPDRGTDPADLVDDWWQEISDAARSGR